MTKPDCERLAVAKSSSSRGSRRRCGSSATGDSDVCRSWLSFFAEVGTAATAVARPLQLMRKRSDIKRPSGKRMAAVCVGACACVAFQVNDAAVFRALLRLMPVMVHVSKMGKKPLVDETARSCFPASSLKTGNNPSKPCETNHDTRVGTCKRQARPSDATLPPELAPRTLREKRGAPGFWFMYLALPRPAATIQLPRPNARAQT